MTVVGALTAARMLIAENNNIVSGFINPAGNLILTTKSGDEIDAGYVRGPQGIQGVPGEVTEAEMDAAIALAHTDIPTEQLANSAVTSAKLQLLGVEDESVASEAVTTAKLKTGGLQAISFALESLTSAKLQTTNLVTTPKIEDLSIPDSKLPVNYYVESSGQIQWAKFGRLVICNGYGINIPGTTEAGGWSIPSGFAPDQTVTTPAGIFGVAGVIEQEYWMQFTPGGKVWNIWSHTGGWVFSAIYRAATS